MAASALFSHRFQLHQLSDYAEPIQFSRQHSWLISHPCHHPVSLGIPRSEIILLLRMVILCRKVGRVRKHLRIHLVSQITSVSPPWTPRALPVPSSLVISRRLAVISAISITVTIVLSSTGGPMVSCRSRTCRRRSNS